MARKRQETSFTQQWVKSLPIPTDRQEWFDSGCKGLTLRIGISGKKSFYFFGRVNGHLTRMKLGDFPDMPVAQARNEVTRLRGDAARGETPKPRTRAARDELTLGDLFAWYLRTHAKLHKRTWRDDERRYQRVLLHWDNRRLSTITREIVKDLHTEIGTKDGPYAGNKMLELLGFMWRLGAQELKYTAEDPTAGIKRFEKHDRERYLTSEEIPRFFEAVAKLQRPMSRDFILLALFTGARRSNVAAMKWDDIDLEKCVWTVRREESKNKSSMRVILSAPAMEILNRRRDETESKWVFPSHGKTGHYTEPKGAMQRIKELAGLTDVRLHDLRRTLGSWQAIQGASLPIIGKSLGHTSLQSTKIYARLADDPVRTSVETATAAMIATQKKSEK
jgi:integrase